jgi:hypothetical protein
MHVLALPPDLTCFFLNETPISQTGTAVADALAGRSATEEKKAK